MSLSMLQITEFARRFSGSKTAVGRYVLSGAVDANGKLEGSGKTVHEHVTDQTYSEHLHGIEGMGVVPIGEADCVNFCVLDMDVYKTDLTSTIRLLYKHNFPCLPFRSKSGGLHIYLFFEDPTPASQAILVMSEIRDILGLPKDTELFPKQRSLGKGATGNWINLPYFDAENTSRYLYLEDASAATLEAALSIIADSATTIEQVKQYIANLPLHDGPPCLQTIFLRGYTKHRNNYLFDIARYYKAKEGDAFESFVIAANEGLDKPISLKELSETALQSHKTKGDYSYKCHDEPICALCDKKKCHTREFGTGGDSISDLNFEEFTKYDTDPPYYTWKVNGKLMRFYSEAEIMDQRSFREQVFRELHVFTNRLSEPKWIDLVSNALNNIKIHQVEIADDVSPGALFKELLVEFLMGRAMAANIDQLLMGRVYVNEEEKEFWFKSRDLINFLAQKQFKAFGLTQIQTRLMDMQGQSKRVYINPENKGSRIWTLPKNVVNDFVEDKTSLTDVSFLEERPGEAY